MRKSYRRNTVLLAANSALLLPIWQHGAQANSYSWITSSNSSWNAASNWSGNLVPTGTDTAIFTTAHVPSGHSVAISSDGSVGAIIDNLGSSASLTIDGSTNNLTLTGQTVNVPYFGTTSFTGANVVIAATSSSNSTSGKFLNLGAGLTLHLANPQNVIVGAAGSSTKTGSSINIASNIVDGTGSSALTYYGNGNFSAGGGALNLSGSNSFSGGMTIGSADGLNGGQVGVVANANLGTGSIVVNDQGQLIFNANGTYGNPGQLLTLNGTGQLNNAVSSGAIRTGAGSIIWDGDTVIGSSLAADGTNGQVVISSTGANTMELHGNLLGTGNLQKQGGGNLLLTGTLNTAAGTVQIGNGALTVASGSTMPTGDLVMLQSSSNTGIALNLDNALQNVGNLSSGYTQGASSTTFNEFINLGTLNQAGSGGQLNIHQTQNKTFGFGVASNLQATIEGPGSISLDSTSTAALTWNGPNLYDGGTTISGGTLIVANGSNGSATGPASFNNAAAGTVTINSGGNLSSGQTTVFGSPVAFGTIAGPVIANTGGNLFPGGGGAVGSLTVGGLVAASGSNLDFDLAGGTSATFDQIIDTGSLSLADLSTVKIFGSKLATGDYQLISFSNGGSLSGSGGTIDPSINPAGNGRSYTLTLDSTGLSLDIVDTASERYWSTNGGSSPSDGAGTWAASSTVFYNTNPNGSSAYDNGSSADVIIGDAGQGGTITLGSNIRVGGALELTPTSNSDGYTIGTPNSTNTLQIAGGIVASNNATINAPVILEGSQTLSIGGGTTSGQYTVTINGNLSETSGPSTLTKDDVGTLILTGTGSYTGGTVVKNGTLQTTTTAIPATGGITNDANLVFSQSTSGTYAGNISGTGTLTIANTTGTVATMLTGSNSYTGPTVLQSGALAIPSPSGIGTGTIFMNGGTLQLTTADVSLPSTNKSMTLQAGTTSFVNTNGHTLTLNNILNGSGNLTETGGGTLVIAGIHTTDVIGNLAIGTNSVISLAPPGGVSYGFGADPNGNTINGDLVVANPLEIRLQGGTFSGTGSIRVKPGGVAINSRGTVTVANNIILNDNTTPIAGFATDFGASTNDTLAITAAISGQSDVDFTSGAGSVILSGANSYTGATTIDLSTGGVVQLAADNTLPVGTALHITSSGLLDLNGHAQTVASLDAGAATAELINAIQTSNSPATLTINGSANTHFDGLILDGDFSSLGIVLASSNTGSLGLNGTFNSYTGGTTLNGGTLSVSFDSNLGDPNGSVTFGGGNLVVASGITTNRPLTINSAGGTIDIAAGTALFLSGSGSTNWAGGTLTIVDSGSLSIFRSSSTVSVTPGSTLAVGSLSTVTVDCSQQDPFTDTTNSANHVTIVNNGTFTVFNGNTTIAQHIGTGTFSITSGATVKIAPNNSGNSAGVLSIDTDSSSKLDLTNNALAVTQTPFATIQSAIISGYANGNWNGPGLNSSTAAAVAADNTNPHKTGLGYALASEINAGSTFFGQPITSSSVLVRYTLLGDANLDGTVNALDFNALATNFGSNSTPDWTQGNFDYNGTIDSNDFDALAANYNDHISATSANIPMDAMSADGLSTMQSLGAVVPEPTSITVAMCGIAMLSQRRRRTK